MRDTGTTGRAGRALAFLFLYAGQALGQATNDAAPTATAVEERAPWSVSASAYMYFVPDDDDYLQPTLTADRDWLHLEYRFNYEAPDTHSVWAGYNFAGGTELTWEITPILGGIFGDTRGVATGYRGALGWRRLEFYSEGEYVFDAGDEADNFFYNWSELRVAPLDGLHLGVVAQRTRAYETEREIQRGLLAGFADDDVDLTLYVFDPDDDDATVVIAFSLYF